MNDQQAEAFVSVTDEFLRIAHQNFRLITKRDSIYIQHTFVSAKFGVAITLFSFTKEGRILLSISLSEDAWEISEEGKLVVEQFLEAFRKIAGQFQESVQFEINNNDLEGLSVPVDDCPKI